MEHGIKTILQQQAKKDIFPDLKMEHLNRKNLLRENNLLQ